MIPRPWPRRPVPDLDVANPPAAYRRDPLTAFDDKLAATRQDRHAQPPTHNPQELPHTPRGPIRYDDTLSPWDNAWKRLSPAEREWEWTP